MRNAVPLVTTPDFTVRAVSCTGGEPRWSSPERTGGYGIVLVRSGRFRVRARGEYMLAEPATAYLAQADADLEFAHPCGGDVCTSVEVSAGLWRDWCRDSPPTAAVTAAAVPVDGRVELAHLALLRAAREGDAAFAAAETVVHLLGAAIASAAERAGGAAAGSRRSTGFGGGYPVGAVGGAPAGAVGGYPAAAIAGPVRGSRAPASVAGARLALEAREAILAGDPAAAGLIPLAGRLGVSPYHLSRVFRAHTGISLTRYRNRVRVSRALDRLAGGEVDLGRLAADLGFADQAHLTRTVRAHAGLPPGRLRDLLAPSTARTDRG